MGVEIPVKERLAGEEKTARSMPVDILESRRLRSLGAYVNVVAHNYVSAADPVK